MPLLDSFKVDHTRMLAPAVRVAKTMQTPGKDTITVFDLRFCRPNQEILSEKGAVLIDVVIPEEEDVLPMVPGGKRLDQMVLGYL